jgi:hypothetical protein
MPRQWKVVAEKTSNGNMVAIIIIIIIIIIVVVTRNGDKDPSPVPPKINLVEVPCFQIINLEIMVDLVWAVAAKRNADYRVVHEVLW